MTDYKDKYLKLKQKHERLWDLVHYLKSDLAKQKHMQPTLESS
jgi:hypothetical protein